MKGQGTLHQGNDVGSGGKGWGGGLKKNLRDKISRTQEPMGYRGYEKECVCVSCWLARLGRWRSTHGACNQYEGKMKCSVLDTLSWRTL